MPPDDEGAMSESSERVLGRLPKVGIRPVIDGRRQGVRESLEGQTMRMAQAAAALIREELRFPSGHPVDCVIPDSAIGGITEAAACQEKFEREGVGVSLTVTPCWAYGTETMDTDRSVPKAIWGHNGTERPGAVYLAAVLAAHAQQGLPAFGIYGEDVQDADDTTIPADVREKLLRFVKAGLGAAYLRNKSYLAIGSTSMGIAGSIVTESFWQDYLGMRNEYVDMVEILGRIERGVYDPAELERARRWVKEHCLEGMDRNPAERRFSAESKAQQWDFVIKMTMIARDLMVGNRALARLGFGEESLGHNALAAGFQGQRQWTDYYPNGDFMEAILCSSFDWNGKREPFVMATENDGLNAAAMLFGHLLGNTAQVFADVRTYWSPAALRRIGGGMDLPDSASQGIIHLINSGAAALDGSGQQAIGGRPAMKPHWQISAEEVERCLGATRWCPAVTEYFRGGGFSSAFRTRGGMPITLSRVNLVKGLGPVLQIAEGYSVELPEALSRTIEDRTDPSWPTTWFVPTLTGEGAFADVYSVMQAWGANHGSFAHGHLGADLITLASMLRIPVSLHNVSRQRIFRPAAWGAFGTVDLEGADYRACRAYGPLYGRG
jgi:L-fucose/D-arabinose isomerase